MTKERDVFTTLAFQLDGLFEAMTRAANEVIRRIRELFTPRQIRALSLCGPHAFTIGDDYDLVCAAPYCGLGPEDH